MVYYTNNYNMISIPSFFTFKDVNVLYIFWNTYEVVVDQNGSNGFL